MTSIPETLVGFRSELELAISDEIARRARSRRRLTLGSAGLTVAVTAAVIGLLSTLPGPGPSIVDRASAALAAGDDTILHMQVVRRRVRVDGWVELYRTESWQQRRSPYAQRRIERWSFPDRPPLKGGRVRSGRRIARFEMGTAPGGRGLVAIYDAPADTIFVLPGRPPSDPTLAGPLPDPSDDIRALLARPDVVVEGRERRDGRDVIRLTWNSGRSVYLVDARTYAPIELREKNRRATLTSRFLVYEHVPYTARSRALLSLRAQHPTARVVRDRAAYLDAVRGVTIWG
jgi:hypothetical protein